MSENNICLVIVNEDTLEGVRFSSDEKTILKFLKEHQERINNLFDCLIVSDLKSFSEYISLTVCHNTKDLEKVLIHKGIEVSYEV